MNWRRTIGFLICLIVVLPFLFFLLCTVMAANDPEGRIALIIFIPVDLMLLGAFWGGICLIRGKRVSKQPVRRYQAGGLVVDSPVIVSCPDCGGRNTIKDPKHTTCYLCGAKLRR